LKWGIFPLLSIALPKYSFLLTNCWLKSLWNFLCSAGLHLHASIWNGLHLQQEYNSCLMDSLVSLASFTPATLQSFSCCCLYMFSLTLADLSTGDGCCLHPPFVTHFSPQPPSPFLWPLEHPSAADWAIWQSTLSQVFCSSGLHLLSPLGSWTKSPHCMHSLMKYNPTLDILFLPGKIWCSYHCSPLLLATHLQVGYALASVSPFSLHLPPHTGCWWITLAWAPFLVLGLLLLPQTLLWLKTCIHPLRIWDYATGPYSIHTSSPRAHTWP